MLDDIPLKAKGSYTSAPEDPAPLSNESLSQGLQEIEESGPISKRLDSKNWKTRAKAYEELQILVPTSPNLCSEYAAHLSKFISDSNPAAQEKAVDLATEFLIHASDLLVINSEPITKALIEKVMTSNKAGLKELATEVFLNLFACHKGNFEGIYAGIAFCANNKNVKVQAAGINSATLLIFNFGARCVNFKGFVGFVEKAAAASNPQVRNEALGFYKECFRWVRELVLPFVDKLKKAQQDELKAAFLEIKDAPVPVRWLKSEEHLAKVERAQVRSQKVDVYDMAEAKDIFSKFGEKWVNTVLSMEKWTEKKQALEELNSEANYPKLAEKCPIDLVTLAKRLLNDSNLHVSLQAMRLVGLLSKGQRRYFDSYGKQFFPLIIQKYKDKKPQVLSEATLCLDNLLFSVSIDSVIEEVKSALEDQNPLIKLNTTLWIDKVIDSGQYEFKNVTRTLTNLAKKNTDDSSPEVRNSAFKLISTLLSKYPDVVQGFIRELPASKIKKIEESAVIGKSEEKKVEKNEKNEKKSRVETANRDKNEQIKEPKTPQPKKPPLKDASSKTPGKVQTCEDEDVVSHLTSEEAESVVASLLPSETFRQLKDSNWKEKQTGLVDLQKWVKGNVGLLGNNSEAILRFVRHVVKDWKENNFNVVKSAFELFKIVNELTDISKKSAYGVLNQSALDKLSDLKLVEVYTCCILSLSETVGPKFVVSCLIKGTSDSTKPKVVSESCICISKIISEYGIHTLNFKEVIDFCKSALSQANPSIKKSAQGIIVTIYSFMGEKLLPLLNDVKEATLKVLQEEFSKTQVVKNSNFKSFKGQEERKADPMKALDDVIPRNNIEKLITPVLMKKFADNNWKTRKEALDEFEGILDSNGCRILPVGLENLVKGLVGRMTDPNKAVVRQVLLLSGKFAGSLGADSKVFAKQMLPAIINCLADKQNLLRQDALNSINKWSEEAGIETVILYTAGPLSTDNPELRSELLKWLLDHKSHFKSIDMRIYVNGTLSCLQDRTALIRNLAEDFYSEIVLLTGFEVFQANLKDIKPAILNTLMPVLDKYRTRGEESSSIALKTIRNSGSVQERSTPKEITRKKSVIAPRTEEIRSPIKKSRSFILPSIEICILNPGNKEKRLEIESRYKWNIEEFRLEFVERTKEQAKQAFSFDLCNFLYNPEFKKQVEGVSHLQSLIVNEKPKIVEVIDIVFKWSWLSLQENSNTQLHKAIFEMLQLLINTLSDLQYYLQDLEANLFFPIICEKSGNPNFKQAVRGILHSSTAIYQTEKVFMFVLQGCNSKNAKSKVECLEELSSLIQDFGLQIVQVKDVKAIVKQVNSVDNMVRAAAIQTMAEVYKLAGDKTWQMIGEVSEKVRDLLDQRFKVVSATTPNRRMSSRESIKKEPVSPKAVTKVHEEKTTNVVNESLTGLTDRENPRTEKKSLLSLTFKRKPESFDRREPKSPNFASAKRFGSSESRDLVQENSLNIDKKGTLKVEVKATDTSKSTDFFNKRNTMTALDKSNEKSPTTPNKFPKDSKDISADKAQALFSIELQETPVMTEESMLYESFKIEDPFTSELDKNLDILKNGDISSKVDALVSINDLILNFESNREELQLKANSILEALTKVLISTFDKPVGDIPLRFAKYFLNVLNKVCSTRVIIRELTETSLYSIVEQVLTRLLLEELEKMGDKGEGEMMLKTLNGTMLRLLEHSSPSKIIIVLIRLLSKYRASSRFIKMPSMITRCLMKMMKGLNLVIQQIEVGKVLLAMHEYLIQIKNSVNDDLGVKTLKTFLVEIVKVQGNNIWNNYDYVRQHHAPDMLIEKWILAALNLTVNPFIEQKSKLDPSFVDAVELIKHDFKAGVRRLAELIEKNPIVDVSIYLNSLNPKVAAQVIEMINEMKEIRKEQRVERNERIERIDRNERIERVERNERSDRNERIERNERNERNDRNDIDDKEDPNMGGYNFQEFQKRLTIMKQRYGISNTTNPIEINSTLSDLKNKVNTLLNKPAVPDDQDMVNELRTRIQKLNRTNK